MLVQGSFVLQKAMKQKYAVGAFNVFNLETVQAVIDGAEKLKSPVIMQTSESAIQYAGLKMIEEMIAVAACSANVPVVMHLDHGRDVQIIRQCLNQGYTSIMFDGSLFNFRKNIFLTKKAVALVHKNGASVEAELGRISGSEDKIAGAYGYTNPKEAKEFVEKTGVDALAISIGTSHGMFKGRTHALRFDLLQEIRRKVKIPLVLHGASMVDPQTVRKAKHYGLKIEKYRGVKEEDLRKAIRMGISKINVDTDLRLVFTSAMREFLKKHSRSINPREALAYARKEMQKSVEKHLRIFGSVGKK